VAEVGEGVTGLNRDTVSGAPLVPCMKCADCQRGDFALFRHYSFIGSREQGSFAEYVVMPAQNAVRYDPAIPYEQRRDVRTLHRGRSRVLQGITAAAERWRCWLRHHRVFTLQWAKIFGAKKLVRSISTTASGAARRMGADETVNTLAPDFMERRTRFAAARGFDHVFETAATPATMRMVRACGEQGARVLHRHAPRRSHVYPAGSGKT
jgi:L-iditol 2-dehydrogenase